MASLMEFIAKSTGSYHRTRLKDHPIAKNTTLSDGNIGIKMTAISYTDFLTDETSGFNHTSLSNDCPLLNNDKWPDGNSLPKLRLG